MITPPLSAVAQHTSTHDPREEKIGQGGANRTLTSVFSRIFSSPKRSVTFQFKYCVFRYTTPRRKPLPGVEPGSPPLVVVSYRWTTQA
jgi:hypothetical protein